MESYAQNKQDIVILKYLNQKTNGYFLDIGCGYPITINNTYLMEKNLNWDGLSIDIDNYIEPNGKSWEEVRNSKRVLNDALTINYTDLLEKNNAPKIIDFLSMDLEPPQLTLECLFKVPFDEYQFNVILFEIDDEREPNFMERKLISREYLTSKGYRLIGNIVGQDDLYIHNSITTDVNFYDSLREINIPDHIIEYFNKNL
jgi:hypothetical protein